MGNYRNTDYSHKRGSFKSAEIVLFLLLFHSKISNQRAKNEIKIIQEANTLTAVDKFNRFFSRPKLFFEKNVFVDEPNDEESNKLFLSKICKGCFLGEAKEVMKVVRFLCSDDADFIDGEVILCWRWI